MALAGSQSVVPPYGDRKRWIPKTIEDFGDGGAFPEIHVPQYPLNMGKKGVDKMTLALASDTAGRASYDAVVKQGHAKDVVVWSKAGDLKEKNFSDDQLARPTEEEEEANAKRTKELLEAKLNRQTAAKDPTAKVNQTAKYIEYTPAQQGPEFNSGASRRTIKMVEMPKDPLEPPKFKYQKAPPVPGSPPVPVLHSPPKKLSKDERDSWKIPPCISNWKNPKGFIISLDKRLATDGRDLQENTISDSFAYFSDALNIAEQKARDEVTKRLNINRELEIQRQKEREEELARIAEEARMQRASIAQAAERNETREERIARIERERIREERRLEREREHRLAQRGRESKKTKTSRDYQRDISEKIALGEAVPRTVESMFDSRLFNQTQGMDSGFGKDDGYNIYDKRLFGDEREKALYKAPRREEGETYTSAQSIDEIATAKKFRPHKDFEGVDRSANAEKRTGPVQYERDADNELAGYGLTGEKERADRLASNQQSSGGRDERRDDRDRYDSDRGRGGRDREEGRSYDRGDRDRERDRRDDRRSDWRSGSSSTSGKRGRDEERDSDDRDSYKRDRR